MKKTGGPSFPRPLRLESVTSGMGMTLRDYYIGQALAAWIQALSARRNEQGYSDEAVANEAARLAIVSADAMIAAMETAHE